MMVGADLVALPFALWSAFALRLSTLWSASIGDILIWLAPVVALTGVFLFARLGLYRAVVRFMGARVIWTVATGVVALALVLMATAHVLDLWLPRTVPVIFALVAFVYVAGTRFIVRSWIRNQGRRRSGREAVVIFGAGAAGVQLASALDSSQAFRVVAFIDDDPGKQGTSILGLPVWSLENLAGKIERYAIRRMILAVPSATKSARRRILDRVEALPIYVQTIPSIDDLAAGRARVADVRDLTLDELLGRESVPADPVLLARDIQGKGVLITGAGGSIGSEMVRVVAEQSPRVIVLYERNEFALYRVSQSLESMQAAGTLKAEVISMLGSVTDERRLAAVCLRYGIETLYHAAAYKHVPLVESNIVEGARNNVLGTLAVLRAGARTGVTRLVLISTDKAVRPTNVMGATKRLAEMLLQVFATARGASALDIEGSRGGREPEAPRLVVTMVRFGNVLGSSGSVVPRFDAQIAAGGPVTVTHPEITRFFMSIREAAALVIQAGATAKGGEVFLLDMGEPIKILDLARQMIRLHGKDVRAPGSEHGVEIRFTGLRPGEKLFEELLIDGQSRPTAHPAIFCATEPLPTPDHIREVLDRLQKGIKAQDAMQVLAALRLGVPEFSPGRVVDWMCCDDAEAGAASSMDLAAPTTHRPAAETIPQEVG
ncbi:MAG: polysaccharide biosynthesis protein [Thioalkalivibrionaceae bacterium]